MIARDVEKCLTALGSRLEHRGMRTDIVLLGGASLVVRHLTSRVTTDVDVLGLRLPDGTVRSAYPFPDFLREAANEVAAGLGLDTDWLDDRPGSDFDNAAPTGFEKRLERSDYGPLTVWHLAAADILTIKLIASAERWGERPNKHWDDVRALQPDAAAFERARTFASRIWADQSAAWSCLARMEAELHASDD